MVDVRKRKSRENEYIKFDGSGWLGLTAVHDALSHDQSAYAISEGAGDEAEDA